MNQPQEVNADGAKLMPTGQYKKTGNLEVTEDCTRVLLSQLVQASVLILIGKGALRPATV